MLGWGVDFNLVADDDGGAGGASLRLVSSAGSNLAVNVGAGLVGNAANTIAPGFTAVACGNRMPLAGAGPASTALYDIDRTNDTLTTATGALLLTRCRLRRA